MNQKKKNYPTTLQEDAAAREDIISKAERYLYLLDKGLITEHETITVLKELIK